MNASNDSLTRLIESTYEFGRMMRHHMLGGGKMLRTANLLQMHVLFVISEHEGITMKEVAKMLHVSSPSATSIINRLVRLLWVTRKHDHLNRKLVRLRLTPAGTRMLHAQQRKRDSMLRTIFGGLSKAEQKQLALIHEKLRKHLATLRTP